MNILALSTTSSSGSIAIYKKDHISFINHLDIKVTHSERLLPQIDAGLKNSKINISDIDLVVIANGPGSFTGTRIGLATAKGICMAHNIPLLPINTLELLANNIAHSNRNILALIDARMSEVYAALYSPELEIILPETNTKPEILFKKIKKPVIVVGDGAKEYRNEILVSGIDHTFCLEHQNIPLASTLISIALKNNIPEYDFESISELEPYYLRKSQAELVRDEKLKKQKKINRGN
ncbi:MAG: tRNA (adenosine(37)-N6)-threonylcarbamoyltransferase complex dimerization subunit type 1 TsaB [Candidatus Tenebribacter burtonii]|nr:tRNA (adenosine(37)-N6)-threonylcarbamoyltransferase complex dimerization subunit type 1 TsaB [Candidatus Tenebribacter burtonii]